MENEHTRTRKTSASHGAPVRQPRGWEQRMRGEGHHAPKSPRPAPQTTPRPAQFTESKNRPPRLTTVPLNTASKLASPQEKVPCPPCHWGLLVTTLLMMGLSIPLIYSSSTAIALDNHGSTSYFVTRQILFVLIGLAAMISVSRLPRRSLRKFGWILYGLTVLGLIATKFTPLGVSMGGVERWLRMGPIPFQVSELGKIGLLMALADFWSRTVKSSYKNSIEKYAPWFISGCVLTLPVVGLVLLQPHLSAALVLFSLLPVVTFFVGTPLRQFGKIMGGLVLLICIVIGLSSLQKMPFIKPYQQARIAHFLSSDKEAQGANYQTLQGLRAIERGGWIGVGPGNSLYKQGRLPAPHTDFILAVTGEEWGILGMLILLAMYGAIIFFCMQVAHNATNTFEMLIASGMAALLFIQVFGNMGVVLDILPVTGMPLPFISYGGSGLVCLLIGMGLVLGISRQQGIRET